jgi:hypothetical protein
MKQVQCAAHALYVKAHIVEHSSLLLHCPGVGT